MSLEGQVAVVTGASRGIGKSIAEHLASAGAAVAIADVNMQGAQETASQISATGARAEAFACNVADEAQVDKLFADVGEKMGGLAILVNNAGITRDTLMLRMTLEDWNAVLNVNLNGAFLATRAASKLMMKARYGRIVNLSSIVGLHGAAGQANYSASKAGLIGLTKTVAREFGSRGITCNAVAPGFIETEMTVNLPQEFKDHVIKTAPIARLGSPQDVAEAVKFLASPEAGYITGQVITVDGGLSL